MMLSTPSTLKTLGYVAIPALMAGTMASHEALANQSGFYGGVSAAYNAMGGKMTSVESNSHQDTDDIVLTAKKQKSGYTGGILLGYKFAMDGWTLSPEVGADVLGGSSIQRAETGLSRELSARVKLQQTYSLNLVASVPVTESLSAQGLMGLSLSRFRYEAFNGAMVSPRISKAYYQLGPSLGLGLENKFKRFALGAMVKHTWYGKKSIRSSGPSLVNNVTDSLTTSTQFNTWLVGLRLTVPFSK